MHKIRLLSLLSLFFCAAFLFLFVSYSLILILSFVPTSFGLQDIPPIDSLKKELMFAAIAAISTATGIFSKLVYDYIMGSFDDHSSNKKLFRYGIKSAIISLIVTFAVLGSFMNQLIEIQSFIFSIVFCYQNGFFFQTIISGFKKSAKL
jgi:hypothetical protein